MRARKEDREAQAGEPAPAPPLTRALSSRDVCRRYLIGKRKLGHYVRRGLLTPINVGLGGRTQWRFTPEALREFEERLAVRPSGRRRAPRRNDIDADVANLLAD